MIRIKLFYIFNKKSFIEDIKHFFYEILMDYWNKKRKVGQFNIIYILFYFLKDKS